ncbi:MAG: hypothetical protein IJ833_08730 [Lachnospiraceae bacterium]|nr:hypothetical protein [Lachnospiraceae bacterium]
MTLTKEDMQALSCMMKEEIREGIRDELKPVNEGLDTIANRLDKVDERLGKVENRLDKVENRLDKVENRLDKVESEVSALKIGQRELSKQMKRLDEKVTDTYNLALEAWGQSTENRHWLENGKLPT